MDILSPTVPTEDLDASTLAEAERRVAICDAARDDAGLQQWIMDRCARDPWWWMATFVWTHHPERGPSPLLAYDFQHELVNIILGRDGWVRKNGKRYVTAIYKSREVGGSVICCASALWEWLFKPGSTQFFVSLREDAVDDGRESFDVTLFGKLRRMINSLPAWMRPTAWRSSKKPRLFDFTLCLTNSDNGAVIKGISTSADGLRGARGTRVFVDEANSIPFLPAIMKASAKVGPVCMISSVQGRHTAFARYCHGEILQLAKKRGDKGIIVRRLHYSMMPHLDPSNETGRAAIEDLRSSLGYSEEEWSQEMECNWQASTPGLVFAQQWSDTYALSQAEYLRLIPEMSEEGISIHGWDFGDSIALTAVVFCYWLPRSKILLVDDYRQWRGALYDEVASDLHAAGYYTPSGITPDYAVGDPSGKAGAPKTWGGVRLNASEGWIANLKKCGIRISGQHYEVGAFIQEAKKALRDGKIRLSPHACARKQGEDKWPSVKDALLGYSMKIERDPDDEEKEKVRARKNLASHLAEAFTQATWRAFKKGVV